jgi:hypothetical protein
MFTLYLRIVTHVVFYLNLHRTSRDISPDHPLKPTANHKRIRKNIRRNITVVFYVQLEISLEYKKADVFPGGKATTEKR